MFRLQGCREARGFDGVGMVLDEELLSSFNGGAVGGRAKDCGGGVGCAG